VGFVLGFLLESVLVVRMMGAKNVPRFEVLNLGIDDV
jgi:hypothetical protein